MISRKLINLALLTVLSYALKAQQPDKALIRVRYTFTHVTDTTQRDKPHTENMILVAGKNAAVYTSYDKITRNAAMRQQLQEQVRMQTGGPTNIKIQNRETRPITQTDYFSFAAEGKAVVKERLMTSYLIEEELPKIAWKIGKDTASFSGIVCQKATARYKGRDWTAWFAPDLPFSSGPWKLNGLPGLIVEAYDSNKEVQFQFAGLEQVGTTTAATTEKETFSPGPTVRLLGAENDDYLGSEIKLPANAVKSTRAELLRLRTAFEKDPEGFMNAQMAAQGIKGNFKFNRAPGSGERIKPVVNNPIERAEK